MRAITAFLPTVSPTVARLLPSHLPPLPYKSLESVVSAVVGAQGVRGESQVLLHGDGEHASLTSVVT